ncbi:MAG TPA: M1 family metallopeptidase [Nocardioidaceae bacterium]|nr:M1 family metallopeptidase [Nocardioidaceae bacterium]
MSETALRIEADEYLPGHGDHSFGVRRYDLALDYRVEGNRLSGRAEIAAIAHEPLRAIALDLQDLNVSKVTVDGKPPAKYSHRRGRLEIQLATRVEAGHELAVVVAYSGNPRPIASSVGEAGWEELADGVIVAAQPHGAPSWFPCNDRPSDKASYRVAITAPADYHVISNGSLMSTQRRASSMTWTYEQTEPMASYLATVQIGRYVVRGLESPTPMHVVLAADRVGQLEVAFGRQPQMMDVFCEVYGPYPFASYTIVVTDDELDIPLEAQSVSIFGSNCLSDSWNAERLIAHELSHQWVGNCVTLTNWKDIWLHEGFACYSEWLWSERSGRRSADVHAREHWSRLDGLPQDLVLADPGPALMFDDRVYKRGALLLHALRLTIGDEVFFLILREWVARHRYGSVATVDFIALAEELAQRRLGELFKAWLHDGALPALPDAPH